MTENDYEDILDNNVEDAKKAIRDLENPDYGKLLDLEKKGKDRKTIKQFLESRAEGSEDEEVEEVAEEIEEETSGGVLGSYSPESILAGGAILGIVIGLIAGLGAASMTDSGSPQQVTDSLNSLFEAYGQEAEIIGMEEVSGVYQVSVNISQTNPETNETQEATQQVFVSKDGEYLFQGSAIDQQIQQIQRIRSLRRQQANQTANTTGQ